MSGRQVIEGAPPTAFDDYVAVVETIYRFALCLDTRDWDGMGQLFSDEVHVYTVGAGLDESDSAVSAATFVWRIRLLETGFDGTQLMFANPVVEIRDDEATVTAQFYGEHVATTNDGDPWYTVGGIQVFKLCRVSERWRISDFKITPSWSRGNRALLGIAVERGLQRLAAQGVDVPLEVASHMKSLGGQE